MKCLVVIVGPTAIGKSNLGIYIAQQYSGEIVNADSRQIYKYMDIGTAKPAAAERVAVQHHLLDIIYPDQLYSISLYQQAAYEAIDDLHARRKLPILVGGSGQYIWSVVEGWKIPGVGPDQDFRNLMMSKANEIGTENLYQELAEVDPVAAGKILPNNLRRIIRALEIYHQTGIRPSELQAKVGIPYPVLIVGLTMDRNKLYEIINDRTDAMIKVGFIDEVRSLLAMGYSDDLPSMSSLGYRQIAMYLKGISSRADAIQKIKYETHRFARSQYAWFRLNDSRIKWIYADDDIKTKINYTIETFLGDIRQV